MIISASLNHSPILSKRSGLFRSVVQSFVRAFTINWRFKCLSWILCECKLWSLCISWDPKASPQALGSIGASPTNAASLSTTWSKDTNYTDMEMAIAALVNLPENA